MMPEALVSLFIIPGFTAFLVRGGLGARVAWYSLSALITTAAMALGANAGGLNGILVAGLLCAVFLITTASLTNRATQSRLFRQERTAQQSAPERQAGSHSKSFPTSGGTLGADTPDYPMRVGGSAAPEIRSLDAPLFPHGGMSVESRASKLRPRMETFIGILSVTCLIVFIFAGYQEYSVVARKFSPYEGRIAELAYDTAVRKVLTQHRRIAPAGIPVFDESRVDRAWAGIYRVSVEYKVGKRTEQQTVIVRCDQKECSIL